MAKFLVEATYTSEGLKGLMKDTGVKRRAAVAKAAESVGGKLDLLLFSLGEHDALAVFDLPDTVSATALALAVSSSGVARTKTTALLTPEEMDKALAKTVSYRAAGKA